MQSNFGLLKPKCGLTFKQKPSSSSDVESKNDEHADKADPSNQEKERSLCLQRRVRHGTVAILAQGTLWAVAAKQAFLVEFGICIFIFLFSKLQNVNIEMSFRKSAA